MAKSRIIIIKKKVGHGGHHGGAWKVAYADFVTAMMALFIVLWLLGSSSKVKEAVADYFKDPAGTAGLLGTKLTGNPDPAKNPDAHPDTNPDMNKLKAEIEKAIQANPELKKLLKQIELTVTPEGLRIELIEDKNGTFFESGSAQMSRSGQEVMALLAPVLKKLPNQMLIEGYTDAKPYASSNGYSNWDLSADRANTARRLLEQGGVTDQHISQIRGYADQMLRNKKDPFDPSNRRISMLVKNLERGSLPIGIQSKVDLGQPSASARPESGEKKPAEGQSAPKPGSPGAGAAPASASGKPSAAQPAVNPGLLERLKSALPAKK